MDGITSGVAGGCLKVVVKFVVSEEDFSRTIEMDEARLEPKFEISELVNGTLLAKGIFASMEGMTGIGNKPDPLLVGAGEGAFCGVGCGCGCGCGCCGCLCWLTQIRHAVGS